MELLSKTELLQKLFDIKNVQDFKRFDTICEEPEEKELLGFDGDKMIFKTNIMDNLMNTNVKTTTLKLQNAQNLSNSAENPRQTQHGKQPTIIRIQETSKICDISTGSAENKEVKIQKVILDPKGKKFLVLNGQKLQIIKHALKTLPPKVDNDLVKRLPTLFPKIVPSGTATKTVNIQPKKPIMHIEENTSTQSPSPKIVNIPPKFSGRVVSINKSNCPIKLSTVMKEVGGTIRLVNTNNLGNPPAKNVSSSTLLPTQSNTVKVPTTDVAGKMENSQCICKLKQNLTSVSTNTDQVKVVDIGVQTDKEIHNLGTRESQSASPLGELFSSDVIIGDDVNMGHGPPGLFALNERKMKLKFFQDLQSCLKWDSGRLPIHKAVVDQDLPAVKSQCVILKIRKVGVDIPDSNNYTPLQLSIISGANAEIVRILLENKADMSVIDSEGNNILHLAVEHNRNDLVKIFLEKLDGSDLNIDHFNYEGVTPLMMCALLSDRIDMAEQLLKSKADLNLRDRKSGRSAIFHAAVSHNAPMVLLLLDYSADTKVRNFFGTSVHDAMFELDDIPNEIKYPILGRDLKINEKRKLNQQDNRKQEVCKQEIFKRKKLEIVSTIQKLESKAKFIVNPGNVKM